MIRERLRVAEVLRYSSIVTRDEMLSEFTNSWPDFVLSHLSGYGFRFPTSPRAEFRWWNVVPPFMLSPNLWHMSATSLLACAF